MNATTERLQTSSFQELGLSPALLQAVADAGYDEPTPIQTEAIPVLLSGRDVIGQARTGTGKTAAFSLPMLASVDPSRRQVQALVLTPTRELALQVAESLETYARHMPGLRVLPVYGGQSIVVQLRALARGVHVVVGTPGRVLDHLGRKTLDLREVNAVVIDEADEMLKMGFIEDVEQILEHTPQGRRTALFSATMSDEVLSVAKRHLEQPVTVAAEPASEATIDQRFVQLRPHQKFLALHRILLAEPCEGALVFVRTRAEASTLSQRLMEHGHRVEELHGDLSQAQREQVMARFREKQIDIVIGTDVAARGLDVDHITHVVNYDLPHDADTYTHRIGRTGRAGRAGVAIMFVHPREMRVVHRLQGRLGVRLRPMAIPTANDVVRGQAERFKQQLRDVLLTQQEELSPHYRIVKDLVDEGYHMTEVAAAAAFLTGSFKPVGAPDPIEERERPHRHGKSRSSRGGKRHSSHRGKGSGRGRNSRGKSRRSGKGRKS